MANCIFGQAKRWMTLPIAVLVSILVCAGEAQFQDIHYSVDDNHMTAEVVANPRATGELFLPEQITVGQKRYTVVGIGDKAFKGCKGLTAIVLPKTLKQVYRSAFEGTGIMLKKENWNEGCLWIDSVLIATDKNIKRILNQVATDVEAGRSISASFE